MSKFTELLYEQFNKSGLESYVWVCNERVSDASQSTDPRVFNVRIPSYIFFKVTLRSVIAQIYRSPAIVFRIIRFVRRYKIKIVVLIHPIESSWPFLILRKFLRFRLILSCHGSEVRLLKKNSYLYQKLLSLVFRSADAIAACSGELANEIRKACNEYPLEVTVIPNGVDVSYFKKPIDFPNLANKCITFLHVSNFTDVKRVKDILEAFAIANISQSTRLLMVGDGPNRQSAYELSIALGLGSRVEFVGFQTDVRPFLWKSDVFVMASEVESDPLALIEAMASSLPWIATPFGAVTSLPENECGLLVPPKSPENLARAMAELANDPERCRQMGARGRQRAEMELDAKRSAGQYLELIQRGV